METQYLAVSQAAAVLLQAAPMLKGNLGPVQLRLSSSIEPFQKLQRVLPTSEFQLGIRSHGSSLFLSLPCSEPRPEVACFLTYHRGAKIQTPLFTPPPLPDEYECVPPPDEVGTCGTFFVFLLRSM